MKISRISDFKLYGPLSLRYLFSIESEVDVKEYLFSLLDQEDENVKKVVQTICVNWEGRKPKSQKKEKRDERVLSIAVRTGSIHRFCRAHKNGSIFCNDIIIFVYFARFSHSGGSFPFRGQVHPPTFLFCGLWATHTHFPCV